MQVVKRCSGIKVFLLLTVFFSRKGRTFASIIRIARKAAGREEEAEKR